MLTFCFEMNRQRLLKLTSSLTMLQVAGYIDSVLSSVYSQVRHNMDDLQQPMDEIIRKLKVRTRGEGMYAS